MKKLGKSGEGKIFMRYMKWYAPAMAALLLCSLSACKDTQVEQSPGVSMPPVTTETAVPSAQQEIDPTPIMQPPPPESSPGQEEITEQQDVSYLQALLGEGDFVEAYSGEGVNISHIGQMVNPDLPVEITQFALLDLDHDGIDEVILQLAAGDNPWLGHVILHKQGPGVYGYYLEYRSFYDLKADGTFHYSGGAADWGIAQMEAFSETDYRIERVTYCESSEGNSSYYVSRERTDQETFDQAVQAREEEPSAVWYDFTEENCRKQLEK